MKRLDIVNIDDTMIYELVKKNLYSCRTISRPVVDSKFHHHAKIIDIPKILKNGLLSKRMMAECEGMPLTEKEILMFSDDYHVNGLDDISLSSNEVDLSLMNEDEILYETNSFDEADIVISKNVKALRNTTNYYNEFLAQDKISQDLFRAIDIAILRTFDKRRLNRVSTLLNHYNNLREIALAIKENNLNIPLRELSSEVITLDPEKVIKLPQIKL